MIKQVLFISILMYTLTAFGQSVTTIVDNASTMFRDALIFDDSGNLYCADYGGDAVYKRTPDGTVSTFASGFNTPNGMAFDSNGDMFMCDNQGSLIYKLDNQGNTIASYPTDFPSGIIKDLASDTMIFTVYSSQHELKKLAPDGTIVPFHAGSPLLGPVGLAYVDNDLYVGNFTNREVYRVESDTLIYVATVPGPTAGRLGFLANVGGKLYGTSWQDNKIYEIVVSELDSTILYAGSSNGSDDGPLVSATFSQPNGIIGNAAGDTMYVSQYGSGKLRMIAGVQLGLDGKDYFSRVQLYPNPTSSALTVELPFASDVAISVFQPDGRLIEQKEINDLKTTFNLGTIPGTYFLEIRIDDERHMYKVLKQ